MNIQDWRRKIDEIDRKLVRLLSQRAECSLAIGRLKRAAEIPLFHRKRERQIAKNVRCANRGPLPDKSIQFLFEQILRVTRAAVRRALRPPKAGRATHRTQ